MTCPAYRGQHDFCDELWMDVCEDAPVDAVLNERAKLAHSFTLVVGEEPSRGFVAIHVLGKAPARVQRVGDARAQEGWTHVEGRRGASRGIRW